MSEERPRIGLWISALSAAIWSYSEIIIHPSRIIAELKHNLIEPFNPRRKK